MTTALLSVAVVLLAAILALALLLLKKVSQGDARALTPRLDAFEKAQERTERAVREEVAQTREESGKAAREQRQELTGAFKTFGDSVVQRMMDVTNMQKAQLDAFSDQLASFAKASGERLDAVRAEAATGAKQLREEVLVTLKGISETMTRTMGELANAQMTQLGAMVAQLGKLSESNEKKLESVRTTVESKLQSLQSDNAAKLEQMRATVEEKLQGTLDTRLGESFKQVSERLEQVYKGLGEMQTLATGVGDLKKVLTNVKTRGTWGEVQLGAMLEQVLNPDQYAANVVTKDGGGPVEFAVKLPGRGADQDEIVWLPVDAKFPIEDYQRLVDAQEKGEADAAEAAAKQLENRVKACARDICEKYLNPPRTTDFGVLFLPIEGLFAEVVRRAGLADFLQREHRVMIAGPTTLWSILNSLQMGFRTLAIQKRSSEVWNLLAAVKAEWSKYGEILDKVHKKLHEASDTIEKAQTRTRAIGRKLRDVEELPAADAGAALMLEGPDGDPVEDEKTS
ncbi:MAG TPA: DNA recombination protein RmuC [Candidatus Methylomirabilis sp.]|nr:DNA recombination protein RmuC [Candidatus Methylomirabilis sp.]